LEQENADAELAAAGFPPQQKNNNKKRQEELLLEARDVWNKMNFPRDDDLYAGELV
jgi:hypothetical protein